MEEDFHIKFLKDIRDNPKTHQELEELYPNEWPSITSEITGDRLLSEYKDHKLHLSFNSRFKLLEYEELKEARKSSRQAMKVARWAIIISIITGISSIYFSYKQLNKPLTIEKIQKPIQINESPFIEIDGQ